MRILIRVLIILTPHKRKFEKVKSHINYSQISFMNKNFNQNFYNKINNNYTSKAEVMFNKII